MWGYKDFSEIEGKTIFDFYKGENKVGEVLQALNESDKWIGRLKGKHTDGHLIDTIVIANVIRDSKGHIIGSTALFLYDDDVKRLNGGLNEC